MKVLSRLNIKTKAAVKDIPADLKKVIEQNYPGGMKGFTFSIYDHTGKDLNELQMAPDTFTKATRLREKDILDIVGNNDKILVLSLTDKESQNYLGMIVLTRSSTSLSKDNRYNYNLYSPSKNKTVEIMGHPKNVIWSLNNGDFDYKAWIIDLSKAESTMDKRAARRKAQEGIIKRYAPYEFTVDKSGYRINRNKYVDMLKELKQQGNIFIDQIAKISSEMFDLIGEINKNGLANDLKYALQDLSDALSSALRASVSDSFNSSSKATDEKIKKLKNELDYVRKRFEEEKAEK